MGRSFQSYISEVGYQISHCFQLPNFTNYQERKERSLAAKISKVVQQVSDIIFAK